MRSLTVSNGSGVVVTGARWEVNERGWEESRLWEESVRDGLEEGGRKSVRPTTSLVRPEAVPAANPFNRRDSGGEAMGAAARSEVLLIGESERRRRNREGKGELGRARGRQEARRTEAGWGRRREASSRFVDGGSNF